MNAPNSFSADVIVVGAGAAGSVFAERLASAGRRVVVLEAGPAWGLTDLVSSQLWARRLKWAAAPVMSTGEDPYGFAMASGGGFGGSALHHYGGWPRLQPEDFELHRRHGVGRDWPMRYETLRPFYDRIQREIGLSGDARAEVWRPKGANYPLPALDVFAQGRLLARGFHARGRRTAPYPAAILSRAYGGRAACQNDGWCDAGCPIGSLANPLIHYLPRAQRQGARVLAGQTVARVLVDERDRVTGVDAWDAEGRLQRWRAPVVVLAGGPVYNARLLLLSSNERRTQGLSNTSGLVGQGMAAHVLVPLYAFMDEQTEPHLGTSGAQLISQDDYGKRRDRGFGSLTWAIASALKPNDLLGIANVRPDLHGAALHDFIRRGSRHLATMSAICETVPAKDKRLTLGEARDRFNQPIAHLEHTLEPDARVLVTHARDDGLQTLKAAGAREAFAGRPVFNHLSGGTVMGSDPRNSVTDKYGRSHDVRGLWMAGAGLFPSIGAVNPTFTVHALALRSAERLLAQGG